MPPPTHDHTSSASGPALSSQANYEKLAAERTAKIQKFKEQKELEKRLKASGRLCGCVETINVSLANYNTPHWVEAG